MYLNEKAWEVEPVDKHNLDAAMNEFLHVYASLARDYGLKQVYVSSESEPYLASSNYSINQWMHEADADARMLYRTFWKNRTVYQPEEDYEFIHDDCKLVGCLEAYLENSFTLSLGVDERWKVPSIDGKLYSLEAEPRCVSVKNLFSGIQLDDSAFASEIQRGKAEKIYSYDSLWGNKEKLFPHLKFCPSVKDNIMALDRTFLPQIINKLEELERYCRERKSESFSAEGLSKTTPESSVTLEKYRKEHTFTDESGKEFLASWHMRFTGIDGRIFFIPDYEVDSILICYIGKKLPTVKYHT